MSNHWRRLILAVRDLVQTNNKLCAHETFSDRIADAGDQGG